MTHPNKPMTTQPTMADEIERAARRAAEYVAEWVRSESREPTNDVVDEAVALALPPDAPAVRVDGERERERFDEVRSALESRIQACCQPDGSPDGGFSYCDACRSDMAALRSIAHMPSRAVRVDDAAVEEAVQAFYGDNHGDTAYDVLRRSWVVEGVRRVLRAAAAEATTASAEREACLNVCRNVASSFTADEIEKGPHQIVRTALGSVLGAGQKLLAAERGGDARREDGHAD